MKVLYQSQNYRPERVDRRYLHIDRSTGRAVIVETGGPRNYTMRAYELPEADYARYSQAITEAQQRRGLFPYEVELREDTR